MDGRAPCRATTLILSGAGVATAALLLLSVLRPDFWPFGSVTSDLVLSKPHRVPVYQDVRSRTASAAAEPDPQEADPQPQPRPPAPLPSPLQAPGPQHAALDAAELGPDPKDPDAAADLLAPEPDAALQAPGPESTDPEAVADLLAPDPDAALPAPSPELKQPDAAAELLAPAPGAAPLAVNSDAEPAAAPDAGDADAALSAADADESAPESPAAPPGKLAADLAADIGVDPDHNKFNPLLIADLTAAAAEARAPIEPDASCVADGGTVCRSVARAKALLGGHTAGAAGRVFIPMLIRGRDRLCCSLSNMQKQVFLDSPADLFFFSANNSGSAYAKHRCPGKSGRGNIYFLAHDEHWVTPPQAGDPKTWRTTKSENYRRMGHWRLLFQFEFAERMGYRYLWQTDDDSRLLQPMGFDLAAHMRQRGLVMASKRTQHDPLSVTTGLPELTAYFLLNEGREPETLFRHCKPPNREGLITQPPKSGKGDTPRGWDRTILYGNCVVIDVRFWRQPAIQRYLQLVVGTGAHFRLRWQEQAVEAMVWQIFVPPGNFSLLDIEQVHPSRAC